MGAVHIKINGLVFDRATYDAARDVLYLARGDTTEASDAALTPEGHGIRYDSDGHMIGVTIINARWLLDRDGHVTITLPREVPRIEAYIDGRRASARMIAMHCGFTLGAKSREAQRSPRSLDRGTGPVVTTG